MRPLISSRKAAARSRNPPRPGAQRFFQYNTMLDFGTPAVLGSPTLQRFNEIPGDISNQKLRHDSLGLLSP